MKLGRTSVIRLLAVLFLVVFTSGSCIFSPKEEKNGPTLPGKWQEPQTPDKVLHNLKLALDELNMEYYRNCLHDNYFYESPSALPDEPPIRWSKSEDVSVIGNLMKGTTKFVFNAIENSRTLEYGIDYPDIPVGATVVEDHPTEVWTVINYTVDMEIFTKSFGDLNVHQYMDFKFRQDPNTKLWSIILWYDRTDE
jgi:hypothetical protein